MFTWLIQLKSKKLTFLRLTVFLFNCFICSHDDLKLLSSKNITTHTDGWIELNVTSALKHWIGDKENNKGLFISAYLHDKPEKDMKLEDIGLINSRGDDEFQPFMAGFFKGQEVS